MLASSASPRLTWKIFHISTTGQNFKIPFGYFLALLFEVLFAKFQPSSFETERGV